jgi:hypothetical protein
MKSERFALSPRSEKDHLQILERAPLRFGSPPEFSYDAFAAEPMTRQETPAAGYAYERPFELLQCLKWRFRSRWALLTTVARPQNHEYWYVFQD